MPTEEKKEVKKRRPKKFVRVTIFILKILLVVGLIAANIFLVIKIISKKEIPDNTKPIKVINEQDNINETIKNTWEQGKEKYIFEDNKFTYYDDEKSYYEGNYSFLNGDKALEEMGYNEKTLKEQFGETIKKENVYSLQLMPSKRIINEVDKSKIIKDETKWWFILIIQDDENALGYNKTLDKKYEFKRVVS